MKKTFAKSVSVLLAVWLLMTGVMQVGVIAAEQSEFTVLGSLDDRFSLPDRNTGDRPEIRCSRLVVDDRDADGNWHHPYWVDDDGNPIEYNVRTETVSAAGLPTSYDARNYGYVTAIKDQAGAGSCWAFGSISCMESSMIRQGYGTASGTDYSEAHLVWFTKRARVTGSTDTTYGDGKNVANPFAEGSNVFHTSATLMRGSGVQLESNARWTNPESESAALSQMSQQEKDRYVSYARMYRSEWIYDDSVSAAKTKLIENGNLTLSYYHDDYWRGWNSTYSCYYQNSVSEYTNHTVAIVGWDDNFSRTKFNSSMRPSSNGAWLVKGSWGTDIGNSGYYWLSYSDPSISQFFSFVAKPKETYDNIYQYDGVFPGDSLHGEGCSTFYTANRFRSTRNEQLTHVSFWNANASAIDAKVDVYVANTGYSVPAGTNPTQNMTRVSSASTTLQNIQFGYYTVQLNQPVDVSGKYFTVVITLTSRSGNTVYASVEGETSNSDPYGSKTGQSFVSVDNSTWYDSTNVSGTNYNNLPIKAMTRNTYTLHYDANSGSGAPPDQTGSRQYTISSTKPTRSGYIFLGWNTSKTATAAQYTAGNTITLSGNLTLYAVWKVDPGFTLHYDANGGTGAPPDQTGSRQYTISSTKPTRGGYIFAGWSTSKTATTAQYTAGNTITLSANLTLYAVWRVDTGYTLHYDPNGGTGAPPDQTGGTRYTIPSVEPSRAGYAFLGWSKDRNAAAPQFYAGNTLTISGDLTLYAVWKQNPTGSLSVSPAAVSFTVGGSAQITCTVSGYSGITYKLKVYPSADSKLSLSWGSWESGGTVIKLNISGDTVCSETLQFDLINADNNTVLETKSATVRVKAVPSPTGTFTVSTNEVSFKVGDSATVSCSFDGYAGHEWVGVEAYTEETQDFLAGSWGDWSGHTRTHTLTASEEGTATVVYVLYDADTDEVLASQKVKVTVTKKGKSFFEILWDIISFPFRIILYPFILLGRLIFG